MSLDKILGIKKSVKKSEPKKEIKKEKKEAVIGFENRHFLKCTKKGCKMSRIVRKKTLSPSDLICPKCNSPMREGRKAEKEEEEE